MGKLATYYTGQDIVFAVDLKSTEFANTQDVIVDVYNNDTLVKTLKKTETDEGKQVIAITGQPTQCLVRVFKDEVAAFVDGYVRVAITIVTAAEAFPDGRHDKYFGTVANFEKL